MKDKKQQETLQLPVELTEEELLERGQTLARLATDISVATAEHKRISGELKDRITALESQRFDISKVVRDKAEPRPVLCEWKTDLNHCLKSLIRLDTGEIVSSRPLYPAELQTDLSLDTDPDNELEEETEGEEFADGEEAHVEQPTAGSPPVKQGPPKRGRRRTVTGESS